MESREWRETRFSSLSTLHSRLSTNLWTDNLQRFALVVFIIFIALVFDYVNGFHDAANSIATVVATRVLSPGVAVAWAAFFNFIAFAVFGTAVAKTIGGDMVNITAIAADYRLYVLLAALLGAVIWNLITWYLGLPTSSSHALVGAYAGGAIAAFISGNGFEGVSSVLIAKGWIKTLTFIVLSPLIGMTLGFVLMITVYWLFRRMNVHKIDKGFRIGQLFSCRRFFARTRRQRRAENDGNYHYRAGRGRIFADDTCRKTARHSALGSPLGTRRHRTRNAFRRLADRQNNGNKNRQTPARRRFLRRNCRCDHAFCQHIRRHSRFDDAHDHRLDCRSRLGKTLFGGQMGRCRKNRLGVDFNNSRWPELIAAISYEVILFIDRLVGK